MKELPFVCRDHDVRAILEGRKTMTRRIVKPKPLWVGDPYIPFKTPDANPKGIINCPFGQPGDRLWVRETWAQATDFDYPRNHFFYRATYINGGPYDDVKKWRPSIHMPRWASRITLEIVSIRVERLQEISEEDAIAEGIKTEIGIVDIRCYGGDPVEIKGTRYFFDSPKCDEYGYEDPVSAYAALWESINGPGSWDANPWVWVVEFKRIEVAGKAEGRQG